MVQQVRTSLPMQGTRDQLFSWEDSTARGATKPTHRNYRCRTPRVCSHNERQLICDEQLLNCNKEQPPPAMTRESLRKTMKVQVY